MKHPFFYGLLMAGAMLAGTMTSALAEPLDIKTGLWEMTGITQGKGQLPIPEADMKNMSPQQLEAIAKVEAFANQPHKTVYKSCLTQKELENGETDFLSEETGMKCESKLSKHTRTSLAGTRHCTKPGMQQTVEFAFSVQDREHGTGTMNITFSDGTRTLSSKGKMSSRWISASCGKTQ